MGLEISMRTQNVVDNEKCFAKKIEAKGRTNY